MYNAFYSCIVPLSPFSCNGPLRFGLQKLSNLYPDGLWGALKYDMRQESLVKNVYIISTLKDLGCPAVAWEFKCRF